ncbi:MAG: hypothetical protein HDR32_08045 [Treponema sp.]|nr:hypothetical protein [Treponema sp.]
MNVKKIAAVVCAAWCAAAACAVNIENALQQVADQFSASIKKGTTIAIIGISSDTKDLSDYMLDELTMCFVQTRSLTVANRANLDAIKAEMNFQLSGEVSDDSIQQIGAMVGANIVVHGSLKPLGRNLSLVVQALDVTSAAVVDMCRFSIEQNDTVKALLAGTPTPAAKQSGKSAKKNEKSPANAAIPQTAASTKSVQKTKPTALPQDSGEYHIVDLTEVQAKEIQDNCYIYNRGDVPIQVAVYSLGANNAWVYEGGIMVKKRSSGEISELSDRLRPAVYGVRVVEVSGKDMNFLVSWDVGHHDLRIYIQPSFF